jgi:hypothetical protein
LSLLKLRGNCWGKWVFSEFLWKVFAKVLSFRRELFANTKAGIHEHFRENIQAKTFVPTLLYTVYTVRLRNAYYLLRLVFTYVKVSICTDFFLLGTYCAFFCLLYTISLKWCEKFIHIEAKTAISYKRRAHNLRRPNAIPIWVGGTDWPIRIRSLPSQYPPSPLITY